MYRYTSIYYASKILLFLFQIEGKILHHKKDYGSFCCDICFIAVIWNLTHDISEVCLLLIINKYLLMPILEFKIYFSNEVRSFYLKGPESQKQLCCRYTQAYITLHISRGLLKPLEACLTQRPVLVMTFRSFSTEALSLLVVTNYELVLM